MTCPDCEKWERQAKVNCQTVMLQVEQIKGLRAAIKEIINALLER